MTAFPKSGLNQRSEGFAFDEIMRRFFQRADEDYFATRILYFHRLNAPFLWSAQQTLEKYVKSALLLRQRTIRKKKGHNLSWLLGRLKEFDDINLPDTIAEPKNLQRLPDQVQFDGSIMPWPFEEKLDSFVSRLSEMGGANSRYNESDYSIDAYDLEKFDLVSKLFRDCSLHTPQIRLPWHEPKDIRKIEKFYFGRLEIPIDMLHFLQFRNYAYWPERQTRTTPTSLEAKNNIGWKKILKDDPDFISAMKFVDSKIV